MSEFFFLGIIAVGYVFYRASRLTMQTIYKERPTRPGDIGVVGGYQDLDGAYMDPRNTVSNDPILRVVRREDGQFGCPRIIYEGNERGSNIVTYGPPGSSFYNKF
jgi:hypothetical protein